MLELTRRCSAFSRHVCRSPFVIIVHNSFLLMMSNRTLPYQPWFLFTNLACVTISTFEIGFGLLFVAVLLHSRTLRATWNLLAINTVLSLMLFAVSVLIISINTWECDSQPDQCTKTDACIFRNYLNDVATTTSTYSLVVQSIHRYIAVLYPNHALLQKTELRIALCVVQWLTAIVYPLYFVYIHPQLAYDSVTYVCVISSESSALLSVYVTLVDAVIPFTIITGVYLRLYVYVRRLRRTSAISLTTKREVRMAKRVFFLLAALALGSVPGIILKSIQPPADYQMRIYYFGVLTTSFFILLCLFAFTPQVKQWFTVRANKLKAHWHPRIKPHISRVEYRR